MDSRKAYDSYSQPMLTYEVHLGSWRFNAEGEPLTYRELADQLVQYVKDMHYTHIEIMPLCEYPLMVPGVSGNWILFYYEPVWQAGRFYVSHRCVPSQRHWCHTRLGAGTLLPRCPRATLFDGEPCYESGNPILAETRNGTR